MASPSPKILLTGAAGGLGQKLRRHFASLGWTMTLIDIEPGGDPAVIKADLSAWDEAWTRHCIGVDAVIHLAGQTRPDATWDLVVRSNVAATHNVYEAARQGARRVVFASSNWVMAGYRYRSGKLTADMPPAPINPYGVSKVMGESLGQLYHERFGLSSVCFRIGYCLPGENRPGQWMDLGTWGQRMWLSDRDLCQAMERAVLVEDIGFAVLNLMSDNPGMRWDIGATRAAIGYQPLDGTVPALPFQTRAREAVVSTVRRYLPVANTWRSLYEAGVAPADEARRILVRHDCDGPK